MILSFDAAHTLMDVRWHPGRFAYESATEFGLTLDEQVAIETYDRLVMTRRRSYEALNLTRDRAAGMAYWDELTSDWLSMMGLDPGLGTPLSKYARAKMYAPETPCFRLYHETVAVLEAFHQAGTRMIVLSNWDYSLDRTLEALGIDRYFERTFASLEHGVEKPEPELFRIVEKELAANPQDFIHVGDNPIDDLQGALGAGWRAILLDRSLQTIQRPRIPDLTHLQEALLWAT